MWTEHASKGKRGSLESEEINSILSCPFFFLFSVLISSTPPTLQQQQEQQHNSSQNTFETYTIALETRINNNALSEQESCTVRNPHVYVV